MKNNKTSSPTIFFFFFFFITLATILNGCHSQNLYLDAHNIARAEAVAKVLNSTTLLPPMEWSILLERYSLYHGFRRRRNCSLISSGGPFGENLARVDGGVTAERIAMEIWVAERENYDYESNSCLFGRVCDDYTQIIWRNTTRLGCSKVRCNNGSELVSCNYDPIGNILGQRPF